MSPGQKRKLLTECKRHQQIRSALGVTPALSRASIREVVYAYADQHLFDVRYNDVEHIVHEVTKYAQGR